MTEMQNFWRWRDSVNPYRSTAFHFLDLPLDQEDPVVIRHLIAQRRQRVTRGRVYVFRELVKEEQVTQAAAQLLDPIERARNHLLVHHPRRAQLSSLDEANALLAGQSSIPSAPPPLMLEARQLSAALPPLQSRTFDFPFDWWTEA